MNPPPAYRNSNTTIQHKRLLAHVSFACDIRYVKPKYCHTFPDAAVLAATTQGSRAHEKWRSVTNTAAITSTRGGLSPLYACLTGFGLGKENVTTTPPPSGSAAACLRDDKWYLFFYSMWDGRARFWLMLMIKDCGVLICCCTM